MSFCSNSFSIIDIVHNDDNKDDNVNENANTNKVCKKSFKIQKDFVLCDFICQSTLHK